MSAPPVFSFGGRGLPGEGAPQAMPCGEHRSGFRRGAPWLGSVPLWVQPSRQIGHPAGIIVFTKRVPYFTFIYIR